MVVQRNGVYLSRPQDGVHLALSMIVSSWVRPQVLQGLIQRGQVVLMQHVVPMQPVAQIRLNLYPAPCPDY
jgi:hypothetical protein